VTVPALEVEFHGRTQVRTLVELGVFALGYVLAWVFGGLPTWLAAAGVLLFGGVIVFGLVTSRRLRPHRPALRLDAAGVTVPGADTVPWSRLSGVVVGPMRPTWLVGSRRLQLVSFLPAPGAELPGPPHPNGRPQGWGQRVRQHLYGTNLVVLASALTADGDQISAAAQALGGLPVRHERYRGLRHLLVMGVAAVLLGGAIALVLRFVS
jgi:hypothetical protein